METTDITSARIGVYGLAVAAIVGVGGALVLFLTNHGGDVPLWVTSVGTLAGPLGVIARTNVTKPAQPAVDPVLTHELPSAGKMPVNDAQVQDFTPA